MQFAVFGLGSKKTHAQRCDDDDDNDADAAAADDDDENDDDDDDDSKPSLKNYDYNSKNNAL